MYADTLHSPLIETIQQQVEFIQRCMTCLTSQRNQILIYLTFPPVSLHLSTMHVLSLAVPGHEQGLNFS